MGEAILVGGRMGAVEQVIYRWKQYQAVGTNTYYWNRYNAVETITYKWNKWSSNVTYQWNKYNAVTGTVAVRYSTFTHLTYFFSSSIRYGTSWTYNESTEEFTVSGDVITGDKAINNASILEGRVKASDGHTIERIGSFKEYTNNGSSANYSSSTPYCVAKYAPSHFYYSTDLPTNVYKRGEQSYGTVTSSNSNTYPYGGRHTDNYWYEYNSTLYSKGSTSYGQVASTAPSAYPSNDVSGSYWYESAGSTSSWSKGSTSYPQLSSTSVSAYPNDGRQDSYWYVYDRVEIIYSQGEYDADRLSTDRDRFPDNGYQGGYWYVFDGEA